MNRYAGVPLRRQVSASISQLNDRQVDIRMMTSGLKDDGWDLPAANVNLARYLQNPIQLFSHDPNFPVGNNSNIRIVGDSITARCTFARQGVSARIDEVAALVKDGVIRACSIGFDPVQSELIDPKNPRGGRRATKWSLLECSFVSVPLDPAAIVTGRGRPLSGTALRILAPVEFARRHADAVRAAADREWAACVAADRDHAERVAEALRLARPGGYRH